MDGGKLKVNPPNLINKKAVENKRKKRLQHLKQRQKNKKKETNDSHEINKALVGSGVISSAASSLFLWRR